MLSHSRLLLKISRPSVQHVARQFSTELHLQPSESSPKVPDVQQKHVNDALAHRDYFKVYNLFTVKDLFDARIHYGHKEGSLHDNMIPYIYGSRLGHLIFDLDKTACHLRTALNFIAHMAYRDAVILMVLHYPQNAHLVENLALEVKEFAYTCEWKNSTLPNSTLRFGKVIRLPELIILFNAMNDVLEPHVAIREAAILRIPTVSVVDTNVDPNLVTYPIPGNDDSPTAIKFYCRVFKEAILRGKQKRKEDNAIDDY